MFTHQLASSAKLFQVYFTDYAVRHFLKDFRKKYKGKQWQLTEAAILDDLSHLAHGSYDLQKTQQVDELFQADEFWVFKYDFRIAKTNVSAKASGNRLIGVINAKMNRIDIAVIYCKTNLPKNASETQFIKSVVNEIFPKLGWR